MAFIEKSGQSGQLFLFLILVLEYVADNAKSAIKKKEYGKDDPDLFGKISKPWVEKEICPQQKKHGSDCDAEYPGKFLHDGVIYSPSNKVNQYQHPIGSSMPE